MNYREYINSPSWRVMAHLMTTFAEQDESGRCRCDGCGEFFHRCRMNVHHVTYERLGCEGPEDLRLLCERCHANEHEAVAEQSMSEVQKLLAGVGRAEEF